LQNSALYRFSDVLQPLFSTTVFHDLHLYIERVPKYHLLSFFPRYAVLGDMIQIRRIPIEN